MIGYDVFGGHEYPIDGPLDSELKAWSAARKHLRDIEGLQPTEETGGQAQYGIQDQIFIKRPDGSSYRYTGQSPN